MSQKIHFNQNLSEALVHLPEGGGGKKRSISLILSVEH